MLKKTKVSNKEEEKTKNKKQKKSGLWLFASIVLFLILIVSVLTSGFGLKNSLNRPPANELAEKTIKFINENLLGAGSAASLVTANYEKGLGLCKFTVAVGDRTFDSYVTTDGKLLFPDVIEIEKFGQDTPQPQPTQPQETPKSEAPEVKLFIMSYCPFGLQAQKVLLPAYDLLKEKADIKVHFVNYIMHEKKEIDENLRQYCIQKQDPEEYNQYLSCFVKDGDFELCLTETGIDESRLSACIAETDQKYEITAQYNDKQTWLNGRFPRFNVDNDLNQKYSVQGSPTMIINGQIVSPSRTPEGYKQAICQAFVSRPEECSETLSNEPFSSGFGLEQGNPSSGGECK
ncbi:hypothetical protein ISS21_02325 [Patescibacteria group bacterium]|nr:hypothetical protein [Patescibacteria group bacterium]